MYFWSNSISNWILQLVLFSYLTKKTILAFLNYEKHKFGNSTYISRFENSKNKCLYVQFYFLFTCRSYIKTMSMNKECVQYDLDDLMSWNALFFILMLIIKSPL